jgi:hypothetical protein
MNSKNPNFLIVKSMGFLTYAFINTTYSSDFKEPENEHPTL